MICSTHRLNLSIKSLCSNKYVNFIFVFIYLFVSSSILKRLKFLIEIIKQWKYKKLSNTLCWFKYDIIKFIVTNYKIIYNF